MSGGSPPDVPSPVDFRDAAVARAWEADAQQRPGRNEMLDRIAQEATRLVGPGDRVLELGSGPGFLAERVLLRVPGLHYAALDFSPAMHDLARARLARWSTQVTFLDRSFKLDGWTEGLEQVRLVVTNQAVHDLRHKGHALGLHRQVVDVLAPGGSYLVSDHFSDPGGLEDTELYLTQDEQMVALHEAGFSPVERLATTGTLVLHLAYSPARSLLCAMSTSPLLRRPTPTASGGRG